MRKVLESLVRMPTTDSVRPSQRPSANGRTVHELREWVLGVSSPIPKMWPALQQYDGVTPKPVLVGQFRSNRRRHSVAELVECPLNSRPFHLGN
jgi:hypothetical protein